MSAKTRQSPILIKRYARDRLYDTVAAERVNDFGTAVVMRLVSKRV
jgi:polyhydroxyalkanoate synthesis regulator protein